jgi:hypothetical protein
MGRFSLRGSCKGIKSKRSSLRSRANPLKILAYLTETFIATFGITRPRPEQERLANLVIGGVLLAAIVGAFSVVGILVYAISHR